MQTVHKRDKEVRTKTACGVGYLWPSAIALTDDVSKVTCNNCLKSN